MKVYFAIPGAPGRMSIALALIFLSPLSVAETDAGLQRVESWLASVQTLQAGFDQILMDESGTELQRSKGTMALQRPGLFRWHYESPTELLVVSDGHSIYSYDVELENVTVMQQTAALSGNPAALLAGSADVSDGYTQGGVWQADETEWVELLPRDSDRDFRAIRLGFAGEHFTAMELHDQLGQITRIVFSGLRLNEDLDKKLFAFSVPEGVDVISSAEMGP